MPTPSPTPRRTSPSTQPTAIPTTAWTEGAFSPATDESIQVNLVHRVTTDHITLLQTQTGPRNRTVTQVTLTFDGGSPVTVPLGAASTLLPGQVVSFPRRTFHTLTVTVDATSGGVRKDYRSQSAVGFAEISIPGVAPATEALRLPTDLLAATGASSLQHQLDLVMTRIRTQVTPPRADPEASMTRRFTLPTRRTFSIGGTARISTLDPDPVVEGLLGSTPTPGVVSVVSANSSGRLPGDLRAGAAAAVDGDPTTSWAAGLGQLDTWVEYQLSAPLTFDHLDLQVVADGRHSIPTSLTVSTPTGSRTVPLPPIPDGTGRPQGSVTSVPVSFPALTGSEVRLTIDSVRPHTFLDYLSNGPNTDPVALADIGLPGVAPMTTPAQLPGRCYSDLVAVDGTPVDVEVSGSTADALANGGLTIRGCGNSAQGIALAAGTHTLTTSTYRENGLNVDALQLGSSPGGSAEPLTSAGLLQAPPSHPSPPVRVLRQGRTTETVQVHGDGTPFWLVLGQSQSDGWKATTSTGLNLSSSTLIDGYANGWYVPGGAAKGVMTISLTWAPQRVVTAAIVVSAFTLGVSLILIVVPATAVGPALRRRRRTGRGVAGTDGTVSSESDPPGSPSAVSSAGDPVASAPAPGPTAALGGDPGRPELASLFRTGGRSPSWPRSLAVALGGGLVAALFVAPAAGLLVAAVILMELLVDRSRIVVVAGTVGTLVVTVGYVALHQHRNAFLSDINWPAHMGLANSLVWVAVFLLASDGLVTWVRHRRGPPR